MNAFQEQLRILHAAQRECYEQSRQARHNMAMKHGTEWGIEAQKNSWLESQTVNGTVMENPPYEEEEPPAQPPTTQVNVTAATQPPPATVAPGPPAPVENRNAAAPGNSQRAPGKWAVPAAVVAAGLMGLGMGGATAYFAGSNRTTVIERPADEGPESALQWLEDEGYHLPLNGSNGR